MKDCSTCGKPKELHQFYPAMGTKDGYTCDCRECRKKKSAGQNDDKRRFYETRFIQFLESRGVSADYGVAFRNFKYVDVVAWGCIGIELKTSIPHKRGKCHWHFTPGQVVRGMKAHIIALEIDDGTSNDYHFFDAHDSIFYDAFGRLRTSLSYTPRPRKITGNGRPITFEMLVRSFNRIDLIEQKRQETSRELILRNALIGNE